MAGEVATATFLNRTTDIRSQIRARAATIGIVSVLLIGAILRFSGLNWDDSKYLHPDERFVTMVATGISWPGSVSEYFDSEVSPLNPYNNDFGTFIYGTFPLFLDKFAGDLAGKNVYGNFHLAARSVSAIFDLTAILLIFLLGRRLFDESTGLLAALLLSLAVLQIQLSHFGTFDTFVTTLCLAAFYFAVRANENAKWWEFALAGAAAGLAVASKLSALPIIAVVALPLAERIRINGWRAMFGRERGQSVYPWVGAGLAVICAIWTFRFTQPYAFLGPSPFSFRFDPRWLDDVRRWQDVAAGIGGGPPSVQWAGRPPVVYVLKNILLWGLGLPLGVTAMIALALAGIRIAIARRLPPIWQIVLVGWPLFHLLYYGTQFIKSIRYLTPAYPFLTLLAAALLIEICRRGLATSDRTRRVLYAAPLVLVVGLTALYALAFTSIYTRTNTRVAASEWIYDNVPQGSTVLTEHWDDPLPLLLPNQPVDAYTGEQLELYFTDDEPKLVKMIDQLDRGDYIFISSNRLYESIPRIPEQYPMTIEYYLMLFSGDLGFELVQTFDSYPQLFGIELNDDGADESFTVYDHPKVLIFKKTDAFNKAVVENRLAAALNSQEIVPLGPTETGNNFLMYDEAERIVQQSGGTWSDIFDRTGLTNRHPIRAWYLALQLMALAAIPLCWRVLHGLPDRGFAVAKTIGLLTAAYVAWLLPSLKLMSFGRGVVLIGVAFTAALSLAAVWRRRREFLTDVRSRWTEMLFVELLFFIAFFTFTWFRSINPDLWHPFRGGEKPMEFAYFNAVIRSTHFPAYDPWFAGGYINYYYFGYVLLASVTRLTGVIPAMAFNLAVPTLFALLVINTWSFVRNILGMIKHDLGPRARWVIPGLALLGPLFVVLLGNLDLARRIGRGEYGYSPAEEQGWFGLGALGDIIRGTWRAFVHAQPMPSDTYWAPSRVIPDTVNEFPYFTYLFADFHPHMAGLTVTSAILVVALAILGSRRWPSSTTSAEIETGRQFFTSRSAVMDAMRAIPRGITIDRGLMVMLVAFLTGMLFPLNAWDFPTYVLLIVGAFALLEIVSACGNTELTSSSGWQITFDSVRRVAVWSAATVVLGRIFFLPYFIHYAQPNSGFDAWEGGKTLTGQYLIVHGISLFFVVSFLLAEIAALSKRWEVPLFKFRAARWTSLPGSSTTRTFAVTLDRSVKTMSPVIIVSLLLTLLGVYAVWQEHVLPLLIALAIPVAVVAWERRREPIHLFLCAMVGLALGLSAAVERYALRGDIGRFNTVFKFYLQIWVLFALVAAAGTAVMIVRHRHLLAPLNRVGWGLMALVLIFAGLTYPVLATPARLDDRFNELPRTLDGTAYMQEAVYDDARPDTGEIVPYGLREDLDGINWLLDNVEGSPVILEGLTSLYRWGSRISVYTGLPTVLGWDWHQTQQRAGYGDLINERRDEVNWIFGSEVDFFLVQPLLDKYHVRFIYVGPLEHVMYDAAALAKFDRAVQSGELTVAFQNGTVTIYEYSSESP